MKFGEFHVFALFATLCGFCGAVRWPTVRDGLTSRKRGRVQPRAGGREAETYPAFGGALAHPPELQQYLRKQNILLAVGTSFRITQEMNTNGICSERCNYFSSAS